MRFSLVLTSLAAALAASAAHGATTIINFQSVAIGTSTNGLVQPGVSFAYDRFGSPSANSSIQIFLSAPPFVSGHALIGDIDGGELKLDFSTPVSSLSYGFALSRSGFVDDATVIEVFDPMGGTLGTFAADGDSTFLRGLPSLTRGENSVSGVGPIGSAVVRFNFSSPALDRSEPVFGFDNLTFTTAIPLPTGATMGLAGFGLGFARRSRRS